MYEKNKNIQTMYCIKCGKQHPLEDYFMGCPDCFDKGENASVSFRYQSAVDRNPNKRGMLRYGSSLPFTSFPTLGEGDTPIISVDNMAKTLGMKEVFVKNEFQNPTGSHKDRMSPLIVTRALDTGKRGIVAASSGNAGISIAAYAANAGLACKIISPGSTNSTYQAAIEATGAELITLDEAEDTVYGRWEYMKKMVENYDWYPATNYIIPPVGSNCFGVQGYKTIAYEIYEYFGECLPKFIFIPVSRGDLLWGIFEGFRELLQQESIKSIPKLVCVEPFKRVTRVLEGEDYRGSFSGDYSLTSSIGGTTVTYQAYAAIRDSMGFAVDVPQSNVLEDIKNMAHHGLYVEASSAVIFSALKRALAYNLIDKNDKVLLIATSHGFKNNPEEF